MRLISPSNAFKQSFKHFYSDLVQSDPERAEYYQESQINFESYVQRLANEEKGINLKPNYVPCHHFWFVDQHNQILGCLRIRHNLGNDFLLIEAGHIGYDIAPAFRGKGFGSMMLKLALPKAKQLNIGKALITADEDNIASRKVIEANGGQLESIITGTVFPYRIARYWVDCH